MSRTLTGAVDAALAAGHVAFAYLAELGFDSGTLYFTNAGTKLTWNGNSYVALGQMGSISAIGESTVLGPAAVELKLTGLDTTLIARALIPTSSPVEAVQGRPVTIRLAILDTDTLQVLDSPVVVFSGRMDVMPFVLGKEGSISVKCESRMAAWETPRIRRLTDADQRRHHLGDKFGEFIGAMADKELPWGVPDV